MGKKFWLMVLILSGIGSIAAAQPTKITLQQGLNGYNGCTDKELRDPDRNYGRGPREEVLVVNEY